MIPIRVVCRTSLAFSASEIADRILDVANWTDFTGWGPLPGIARVEVEYSAPEIVGNRFHVTNTDGSEHVEEIVVWNPPLRLEMKMQDFSPPLAQLATHIVEIWEFVTDVPQIGPTAEFSGTHVTRTLELHPRSALTRPALWVISFALKQAIARHLRHLGTADHAAADPDANSDTPHADSRDANSSG